MTIDSVAGGGTAERTIQVSRFLAELGVECTILTLDIGVTEIERQRAGKAHIVILPCLIERYYVPTSFRHILSELVCSTDIVQLMNHWTLLNALVFYYVRRFRKPYVVCPAGALPIFGRSKTIKSIYNRIVGKRLIRQANACVAISPVEISDIKTYGVSEGKIVIIPNGVDADEFSYEDSQTFRRKYGLPDAPLILFMGRLHPIKGPDLLLEAFIRFINEKEFPHHLVFAGPDGGMLNKLQALSMRKDVEDRVHFLGYVGGKDKLHAYRAAEFLVIPSRQEAMSIVVLEAGVTGTPVLITNQCGFDEVAAAAGGMVVKASIEGLHKGLLSMTYDTEKLLMMGQNLEKFIREYYLWDHAAKKYLELFSSIVH